MSKAPKTKPRNLGETLASVVTKATGKWTATKKSEERRPSYVSYRRVRMTAARGLSQKDAAAQVMEAAYLAASANGTLPANARQVMYAARPKIEALTNGKRLDDQYFCQTLLPGFMEEHEVDWDVVFDARGHFAEPHEGAIVNLGTLGVRNYLKEIREAKFEDPELHAAEISTYGPDRNFGAVLFIEKEGFQPLFERIKLAELHDIAIMSTKGISVTAARQRSTAYAALTTFRSWSCTTSTWPASLSWTRFDATQDDINSRATLRSSTLDSGLPTSSRWPCSPKAPRTQKAAPTSFAQGFATAERLPKSLSSWWITVSN